MASGLPVVASDWAGHREWIQDGHAGRLIPTYLPADPEHSVITLYSGASQENLWELSTVVDLNVLTQALDDMLSTPSMLARMGEAALRFARETFDWAVVMRQYDALWQEQFARATHVRRNGAPFPAASFPQLFASYPTRLLRASDVIAVTVDAPGDEFLPALADARYFRQPVFQHVLRACRDRQGGGRLDEIVRDVCDASSGVIRSAEVERHVGRLLKHGLLTVASRAASASTADHLTTTAS